MYVGNLYQGLIELWKINNYGYHGYEINFMFVARSDDDDNDDDYVMILLTTAMMTLIGVPFVLMYCIH